MLPLDDERWVTLTDGYGDRSDVRDLVRRLYAGDAEEAFWEEFWRNLYHQDDVGTASYAVIPHLVEAYAERERDGAVYHYCQAVEDARGMPGNPPLPDWLREGYLAALGRLAGWAGADLAKLDADDRKIVLAFLGQRRGCRSSRTSCSSPSAMIALARPSPRMPERSNRDPACRSLRPLARCSLLPCRGRGAAWSGSPLAPGAWQA